MTLTQAKNKKQANNCKNTRLGIALLRLKCDLKSSGYGLISRMNAEENAPTLESLYDEILELKRSVAELRAMILATAPEVDRAARIQQAKREIFTEYDSSLSELAK